MTKRTAPLRNCKGRDGEVKRLVSNDHRQGGRGEHIRSASLEKTKGMFATHFSHIKVSGGSVKSCCRRGDHEIGTGETGSRQTKK